MTTKTVFESSFFQLQQQPVGMVLAITRDQLTDEENLEQFDQELVSLVDNYQVRRIVLDMQAVRYMTSSAIGKLISLHRRLARNEGRLVICSLQPEVEQILDTSHLLGYFSVSPTRDAALAELA